MTADQPTKRIARPIRIETLNWSAATRFDGIFAGPTAKGCQDEVSSAQRLIAWTQAPSLLHLKTFQQGFAENDRPVALPAVQPWGLQSSRSTAA